MAIEFMCPSCQGMLAMPDEAAGRLVRCGNCLATLRVPDAPPTAPVYEPAERPPRNPEPVDDDRDEHGEPLPRKTRKKKKSGRSPLFWILLTLFGLGCFACLACGGVMVVLGTPRWQPFHSDRGQFSVELPAPPNPAVDREAKLRLNLKDFQVEGTMLVGRVELYWVSYKDLAPKRKADDEELDGIEKQMRDSMGPIESTKAKTVDGLPARELVVRNINDGQITHCLVVIGKSKVYIVAASGPLFEAQPNSRVRHFFDNFHPK